MAGKKRNLKERILAFVLAVLVTATGILPASGVTAKAAVSDQELSVIAANEVDETMPLDTTEGEGEEVTPTPTPTETPEETTKKVNVEFSIVDKDGNKLDDAVVKLNDTTTGETLITAEYSKEKGNFVAENVTISQAYKIVVEKTGYLGKSVTLVFGENSAANPLTIVIGQDDIALDKTEINTTVGSNETVTITNAITTAGNLAGYTWASSDETVAAVAGGTITAKSEGSADITVSYGEKSATVKVTVKKNKIEKLELDVNPTNGDEEKEEIIESVTLTATTTPSEATGTVTFYVIKNGEIIKTETCDLQAGKSEWTYNSASVIPGVFTFDASFAENDKYYGVTRENVTDVTATYKVKKELLFENDVNNAQKVIILGEESEFDLPVKANSVGERKLTYTSNNENVVSVDENGKVTVKGAGTATITVNAASNTNYYKSSAEYAVTVKKVVEVAGLEKMNAWEAFKKTYDGNEVITMTANLPTDVTLAGEETFVTIQATFVAEMKDDKGNKDPNAGVNKVATLSSLVDIIGKTAAGKEVSLKDYYVLNSLEGTKVENKVTVEKRTVYLGTKDYPSDKEIQYRRDNVKEIVEAELGLVYEVEVSVENTGTVNAADVDFANMPATTQSAQDTVYDVKTHEDEIIPDMSLIEDVTNYHFETIADNTAVLGTTPVGEVLGDVTVAKEDINIKELLEFVTLTAKGGNLHTEAEEPAKVYINDGKLVATIQDYTKYYDKVTFRFEKDTYDLTDEEKGGFDVSSSEIETGSISGFISLESTGKDREGNKTEEINFEICVDKTAPEFTFGEWHKTITVVDEFAQLITFNKYKNNYYAIEGVSHNNDESTGGSGVEKWQYNVYKTDADISVDEMYEYANSCAWTEGTEASIPVVTGDHGSIEDVQGNYIVLVKITDNVGNSKVYTTNGIVVEVEEPSIKILGSDDNTIDSAKYYNDDVEYKIILEDAGTTSGLSSATIELLDRKSNEEEYQVVRTQSVNISELIDNSTEETKQPHNQSANEYTLEDIKELSSRTITMDDEGEKFVADIDSNNMMIRVTAYDQAGNSYVEELQLMVDKKDPIVEAKFSYDDAKNDIYFNDDKEMTIVYTEKNFHKDGISFDVYAGNDFAENLITKNATLADLKNDFGIESEWLNDENTVDGDSQSEGNVSTYDDSRTHTLILKFDKDNEYYIVPRCTDLAMRSDEDESNFFIIDKTAPVVNVTYSKNESAMAVDITEKIENAIDEDNRHYDQFNITAKVSIDEKNFGQADKDGMVAPIYTPANGKTVNLINVSTTIDKVAEEAESENRDYSTEALSSWDSSEGMYVKLFEFLADANYTWSITYEDLAGNACVLNGVSQEGDAKYERYFTVDHTKPYGEINTNKVIVSSVKEFLNNITFNIFYSKLTDNFFDIKIDPKDDTAGIKSVEYLKSTKPLTEAEVETSSAWVMATEDNLTVAVNDNEKLLVYGRFVDKSGNQCYVTPENGIIIDSVVPVVTIPNKASVENKVHNTAVNVQMAVTDKENGTVSGIKRAWYEIYIGTTLVTGEQPISLTKSSILDGYDSNRDNAQVDAIYNSAEGTISIPAIDKYNSNNVKVVVYAEDYSGNVGKSEPVNLKIDIKEPYIDVSYDLNNPSNERYYKQTRTATVTIKERNFDPAKVNLIITNTDGTKAKIGGWSHSGAEGTDGYTHTCHVEFYADGDYTFTVDAIDMAGNADTYTRVDEFTIDKTLPIIKVTYDNNSAQNGNYYKAPRTATITITEHNFRASDVKVMTTASNGSAPSVRGWSSSGDRHTATVYFGSDADYTFDVSYIDLAGNAAADYQKDQFTVDLTNPVVEITGVADKSANKGVVAPVIRIDDTNYNPSGVTITLTGAKNGNVNINNMVTRTNTGTGQVLTFSNFADNMDDVYTLTVKSVDKAGNETTQTIMFSVNRHGSAYSMDKATQTMVDGKYTKDPVNVVVYETNVDTLEFMELSFTKDGKLVKLKEGTDYTVTATGGEGQWKKYTYTIFSKCFEEEGKYNINISSTDRAGNESNNKVQTKIIEFTVDHTAPTMAVSNLTDGGRYEVNNHEFTLDVKDNMQLSKVELYLDGELVHTYEGEELLIENGIVHINVEGKNEYQSVKLIAYDQAGNPTDPVEYSVLVSANKWVQFTANKPLFYGSIAGIAAVLGFIFFIIWKKRKDDEEEAA